MSTAAQSAVWNEEADILKVPCQYTLPQVEFVGGSTQDFEFQCLDHRTGQLMDMTGCKAEFAIIDYLNKQGNDGFPLWYSYMQLKDVDGMSCRLCVSVPPSATLDLWGKYIYQISIRDVDGVIEIPKQGLLFISNNIDKNFVKSNT